MLITDFPIIGPLDTIASMVSPQLLDYVRQQLATGVSKEGLSKSLIANGWQVSDINEAFTAFTSPSFVPQSPAPLLVKENNPIKKSVWYRILRSLIVIFGSVSLLAVLLLNLFGLLEGGWGSLILISIVAPYIEGGVIFCAALFVLYCLLYFLKWKREGYSFGKIVLILGILSILPIIAQVYLNFTTQKAQTSFEKANPIVAGTTAYDFSKDIVFHTSIYPSSDNAGNIGMSIKDNVVTWKEYTKRSPPYQKNVIDLFLFKFDPASSQGTVTQVTRNENAKTFIYTYVEDHIVFNGKIYWTQLPSGDNIDRALHVYDISSGEDEVLLTNIRGVMGGYGKYLILSREQDTPDGYTGFKVFLYDLSTKQESTTDADDANGVVSNGYICYLKPDSNIGIYDIETGHYLTIETAIKTRVGNLDFRYSPAIQACSKDRVVLSFAYFIKINSVNSVVPETHLYTLKKDGTTSDQQLKSNYKDPSDLVHNQYVLVGNDLFYATDNSVYRQDITSNGNEIEILSSDGLNGWTTDGNYLVYQTSADQGKSAFYLKKISP